MQVFLMISWQKKIKDFKRVIIKSIDKFNSYIKLDIKKKDIEKKDIKKKVSEKKGIEKKDIEKKDIEKKDTKNSIEHDTKNNNNKPDIELGTSGDIKAHIIDKQKLIKKDIKVYQKQRKLSKIILN